MSIKLAQISIHLSFALFFQVPNIPVTVQVTWQIMVDKFVSLEYRSSPQERTGREQVRELVRLSLENAAPFRSFSSYRSKRNYELVYPFQNLSTQVEFESLLEGQSLLQLDWENTAHARIAQFFRVFWGNGKQVRSEL